MNDWSAEWLADYEAKQRALRFPAAQPGKVLAGSPQEDCRSPAARLTTRTIVQLQPEQRLQIAVVQHWRPRLVSGARLLGINGELPGKGPVMVKRAVVRREMGYTRGTPDLVVIKKGGILWLELKVTTDQSDEQAEFADWAAGTAGHGYAVVTSVEDAGVVLKIWGMLA
jgi:hypothetical protein